MLSALPPFQDRLQFLHSNWLAEIVVHAGRKTLFAITLHGVCRDSNDVNRTISGRVFHRLAT
jgi:hypothetical protein